VARRGKCCLVKCGGLVPVAPGVQEVNHRGGDGDGVLEAAAGRGIADRRVQVGAFGFSQLAACPGVDSCGT
jgi:hypothetical protein